MTDLTNFPIKTRSVDFQKILDAEGFAGDAEAARDQSQAARDTAGQHKDSAAASAAAAASTASGLAGFDLDAIAETKAVTAVDVFVYDTSQDSDGGAWRKRCQHTSWFNEPLNTATRGGRREFPAVAVIVAEANKVTIYDGDDPSLPMWMVFIAGLGVVTYLSRGSGGSVAQVTAKGGILAVATQGSTSSLAYDGLCLFNFVKDVAERCAAAGAGYVNPVSGLAARNDEGYSAPSNANRTLVNGQANDVAITVLPDAPIDPATGLPVPTIAVATDGGASVIRDDGTVVDSADTNTLVRVAFGDDGALYYTRGGTVLNYAETYEVDDFGDGEYRNNEAPYTFSAIQTGLLALGGQVCRSGENGFEVIRPDRLTKEKGAIAYITSTYTTGWMPGDIKGAFLSDTDDTDLTDANLVTNGTFDSGASWGAGAEWTISGGVATIAAGVSGNMTQPGILTPRAQYRITLDVSDLAASGPLYVFGSNGVETIPGAGYSVGTFSHTFSGRASGDLILRGSAPFSGSIDNVVVQRVDADRSVNGNDLTVNGTITREPVATGADLVAYSGFSASDYLEGTDASYADTLYALGWEQTDGVWGFKHGVVSDAPIDGLTITGTTLKIAGTKPKALVRLTATVPTADQLAKIEADERALFQENAACTLYGASDAVTAIAHDPVTDLLHVGTSDGRSVFQGLRRVENTTDAVTAAISANNGMVVDQ